MSMIQYDEANPINFNLVKEGFVDALVSEKFLTPEQGDDIKKNYAVTLVRRGWFGRVIDMLLWNKDSKDEYKLVEGVLFRKFPIYESDTSIKTPTNKVRQIMYRVVPGEQGTWRFKSFKSFEMLAN